MKCTKCDHAKTRCKDTRQYQSQNIRKRKYECEKCFHTFTTKEYPGDPKISVKTESTIRKLQILSIQLDRILMEYNRQ